MHNPRGLCQWVYCLCAALLSATATMSQAATLSSVVTDTDGKPVEDAVVSLVPTAPGTLAPPAEEPQAVMDQQGKQFIPYVLPVRLGTKVFFPNRDNIKHHVYSFSPAKRFELKLYSSGTAEPVIFDKPGVVVLGCNIHDWMLAYIYVVETPYFAKTDTQGRLTITNVPPGEYRATAWHPQLRGELSTYEQTATLRTTGTVQLSFAIPLKRVWRDRTQREIDQGAY